MATSPVTLDFSKAQKLDAPVSLDFSKAQHLDGAPPAEEKPQEGFWHSLGAQFGMTPEAGEEARQHMLAHPLSTLAKSALGPVAPLVEGLYNMVKQSGSQVAQAYQAGKQGNTAAVGQHLITAVPIVGPALDKGADQYADKNFMGEAGTLTGAAAQAAPLVAGGMRGDLPRPNTSLANMMDRFPTRAKAGEIFNKLNTTLKDQPVPLTQSAAPLQRAIEIAARGGTMPNAVSAILQRSQAIEPMTFPEIRDYQASLSDLSASDKLAMNGRMKGAVAQLSKALYQDIRQAAESGGGMGPDYDKAMTQYRQAMQIKDAIQTAKDLATKETLKGVAKGAGIGAGGAVGYGLYKATQR